jgi:hypothetical protein
VPCLPAWCGLWVMYITCATVVIPLSAPRRSLGPVHADGVNATLNGALMSMYLPLPYRLLADNTVKNQSGISSDKPWGLSPAGLCATPAALAYCSGNLTLQLESSPTTQSGMGTMPRSPAASTGVGRRRPGDRLGFSFLLKRGKELHFHW